MRELLPLFPLRKAPRVFKAPPCTVRGYRRSKVVRANEMPASSSIWLVVLAEKGRWTGEELGKSLDAAEGRGQENELLQLWTKLRAGGGERERKEVRPGRYVVVLLLE